MVKFVCVQKILHTVSNKVFVNDFITRSGESCLKIMAYQVIESRNNFYYFKPYFLDAHVWINARFLKLLNGVSYIYYLAYLKDVIKKDMLSGRVWNCISFYRKNHYWNQWAFDHKEHRSPTSFNYILKDIVLYENIKSTE